MAKEDNPYQLKAVCKEVTKRIEQKIDLLDKNVNDKLEDLKTDIVAAVNKRDGCMSGKSKAAVISAALLFASSVIVALIQTFG